MHSGFLIKPVLWFFLFSFSTIFSDEQKEDTIVIKSQKILNDSLNSSVGSYQTIELDQIRSGNSSLAEVLEKTVGSKLSQSGGLGSFSQISLRGSNANQVKILIDGIALNSASGKPLDIGKIPLSNVKKIEIYRGRIPLRYGLGAMGGVVNIITIAPDLLAKTKKTYNRFQTVIGSYSSQKYLWESTFEESTQRLSVWLERVDSENNYKYINDRGTRFNSADDIEATRQHNAYVSNSFQITYAKVLKNHLLDGSIKLNEFKQEISGPKGASVKEATLRSRKSDFNINYKSPLLFSNSILQIQSKFEINEDKFWDPLGEISSTPYDSTDSSLVHSSKFIWEIPYEIFLTSVMVQGTFESFDKSDLRNKTDPKWERLSTDIGIETEVSLLEDSFFLTASIEESIRDSRLVKENEFGNLHKKSYSNLGGSISLKYVMNSNISLFLSGGGQARDPSLVELFGNNALIKGNRKLEPEKSLNFDFSFVSEFENKIFDRWSLKSNVAISLYQNYYRDLILYEQLVPGLSRPDNTSEAETRGIEFSYGADLGYFSMQSNLTYLDTLNLSEKTFFNKKKLPGRSDFNWNLVSKWKQGSWEVYYSLIWISEYFVDQTNLLEKPDKRNQNIGVKWFASIFEVALEIKNLEDIQYEDYADYPLPNRSYWVSAGIVW